MATDWQIRWTPPPHPLPILSARCPVCHNGCNICDCSTEVLLAQTFPHCGKREPIPTDIRQRIVEGMNR